jgi:predicted transcriptional regulator
MFSRPASHWQGDVEQTLPSVIRQPDGEAVRSRPVNQDRDSCRRQSSPERSVFVLEMRLTFEVPADLLRVLTAQRVRVPDAVRKNPAPVSELAAVLKKDGTAVRRDVRILTTSGLVNIPEETNPGQRRRKIVGPLAAKCELVTTIRTLASEPAQARAGPVRIAVPTMNRRHYPPTALIGCLRYVDRSPSARIPAPMAIRQVVEDSGVEFHTPSESD